MDASEIVICGYGSVSEFIQCPFTFAVNSLDKGAASMQYKGESRNKVKNGTSAVLFF
jgi:hypothetical protein